MTEFSEPEKIPVFKKWSRWYWLLIAILAAQIVLFYWITTAFS